MTVLKSSQDVSKYNNCNHIWVWRSGGRDPKSHCGWWNCKSTCKAKQVKFYEDFPLDGVIDCGDKETRKMLEFAGLGQRMYRSSR